MSRCALRGAGLRVAGMLLLALALAATPVRAAEPFGHIHIQATPIEAADESAGSPRRLIRLDLRSLVTLEEVHLTVSAPAEFSVRAVLPEDDARFGSVPAATGRRAMRASLNRLVKAEHRRLEFEILLPPDGDGIVSFAIEGRDESGRTIRDALGLAVREGSTGTRRAGAVEFPATVLPRENPR